jgi:hypothetical protein
MSQSSTKKRKPNPFDEAPTSSKKQRKQPTPARDESPSSADRSTLVADEVPFTLECPPRTVAKKGKKKARNDDIFGPEQEDGGFPKLKITYVIRPGKPWTDLKTYRNFSSKSRLVYTRLGSKANTN